MGLALSKRENIEAKMEEKAKTEDKNPKEKICTSKERAAPLNC